MEPVAHGNHFADLETSAGAVDLTSKEVEGASSPSLPVPSTLQKWNAKIESLGGLEARGIARVLPEQRHATSRMGYVQMTLIWFSANVSANNLTIAMLGPLVFQLGFFDCALCAVFGVIVGSISTAYMSTWGAQSGNRTMVCRFHIGVSLQQTDEHLGSSI